MNLDGRLLVFALIASASLSACSSTPPLESPLESTDDSTKSTQAVQVGAPAPRVVGFVHVAPASNSFDPSEALIMPPGERRDAFAPAPSLGHAVERSDAVFRDGVRAVKVEVFRPAAIGRHPAVIVLHGASGIGDGEGAYLRSAAEFFAERGFVAFLPHYFEPAPARPPTAKGKKAAKIVKAAPPPKTRGPGSLEFNHEREAARLDLVVDRIAADSGVDPDRIGLFGFSLGGFHALAMGARDARVGALVSLGGGMPGNVKASVTRMPPALLLHGQRDRTVPVVRSQQVRGMLSTMGVPNELVVYRDQQHVLRGPAASNALERAAAFLVRRLESPENSAQAARPR